MNLEQPGGFGNGQDMLARLAHRSAPSAPPHQPRRFAIIVGKQRSGHRTCKTGIVEPPPQIVALLSILRAGLPGIADPLPAEPPAKRRSEARRVGEECGRTSRSRWSPDH